MHRLDEAGWLVHVSPTLPDGTNGPTMFMIGNQLKRTLFMLSKSKRRKRPTKSVANSRWQFSPSPEEKKQILIREAENAPPKPELLYQDPELIKDRRFVRTHDALHDWLEAHPEAAAAIQANPQQYLWRERTRSPQDFLRQLLK